MPECQYCGAELDDRYNFCLNCNHQVKCTNCGGMLVRDKQICFVCGQPLVSQTGAQGQLNEFTLEEEQTENSAQRRINGRFSDEAVAHAAALLGGLTRSGPIAPQAPGTAMPYPQQALPSVDNEGEESAGQVSEHPGTQDQVHTQDTSVVE